MSEQTLPERWAPRFFTIWIGQAFSLLGSGLVQFALVWWLTIETRSPTVLAGATLVAMLPMVLLGPIAGPLIDRWNRRLIMIVADGLIALATLWLIVVFSIGATEVWHVYAVLMIRSAAGAFHMPSMTASTSLMVPKEQLSRVAGLNQTLQGITSILSPALGALLLSLFEVRAVLAVDVVTALLAILPLFFIAIPQPPRRVMSATGQKSSFMQDLRAGLRYVARWPGLLAIILMAMLLNFLVNPAFALLPLLVTTRFAGDAGLLATLEALFGIGVIVGGIVLSAWGGFRKRVFTSMMGLIGLGLGIVAIGVTSAEFVWLAVAGMFLVGAMQSMANGPLFAVLQSVVAPDMQGRVLSLLHSGATAMSPLSLLVAGPIADALGVPVWYGVGGVACMLMGALGFFVPAIVHLEDNHAQPAQSEATSEALRPEAAQPSEVTEMI